MNTRWHIVRIFISPLRIATSYASKRDSCTIRRDTRASYWDATYNNYKSSSRFSFFFPLNLLSAAEHTFRLHLAQDLKSRLNANVLIVRSVHYAILMLKYKYWNHIHRYKNRTLLICLIFYCSLTNLHICNSTLI